jgi:hypothetical protein
MLDLQKFCDNDVNSFRGGCIATPWSAAENTFASNGYIIIRVQRRADVPERKSAPSLKALQEWFYKEPKKWFSIPADMDPKPIEIPCAECNGKGKHKYQGSFIECEDCGGEGKYDKHKRIPIGDEAGFSNVYLSWLAELPGIEIAPFGAEEPARFRFEGGDGLLMPMRS